MTKPMGPKWVTVHFQQYTLHQGRVDRPFFQFLRQKTNSIQVTLTRQAWSVCDFEQKMVRGTFGKVPVGSQERGEQGVDLLGKVMGGEGKEETRAVRDRCSYEYVEQPKNEVRVR
jgi:hypothetical protein